MTFIYNITTYNQLQNSHERKQTLFGTVSQKPILGLENTVCSLGLDKNVSVSESRPMVFCLENNTIPVPVYIYLISYSD